MIKKKGGKRAKAETSAEKSLVLSAIDPIEPRTREQVGQRFQELTGDAISYSAVSARIAELLQQNAIAVVPGSKRPLRYIRVAAPTPKDLPAHSNASTGEPARTDAPPTHVDGIPLTPAATRLRAQLLKPRAERALVGYNATLLRNYEPGASWYVPATTREQLVGLGRTSAADQPAGTYARDIMGRLVIDLSYGSSRLEGLQYSRIDTKELLEQGRTPEGASDRDRQIILNHKAAIEFLVESAADIDFNRTTILTLHALLSENLLEQKDDEGALRRRAVVVGSSTYTPPAIPQVVEELFETLLVKAAAIPDPIEQAFFAMVHLPYLQPFIDVNKRTSRLAANIPLVRANLCPLSFIDVPESLYTEGVLGVYEQADIALLRDVFVWAYQRSCAQFKVLREAMGDPDPIRLNYRNQLRVVVREIVLSGAPGTRDEMETRARDQRIPDADRSAFVDQALSDLRALRPELLARYALRPSEYQHWLTSRNHPTSA
ncbi:MAG: Fic family protein [Gemmatimonadetes bacterium]|nr:Fic family protein [Gemmatimonadota bacterium]